MARRGDMASPPAPPLLLASTSPRRREILEQLRIPFDVVAPRYEETEEDPVAALYRKRAIALLVLSVLGATSPIALVIGVIWYRARKREIKEAGPTVQSLVVISLVVSTVYVGLIGLGFLIFKMFEMASV